MDVCSIKYSGLLTAESALDQTQCESLADSTHTQHYQPSYSNTFQYPHHCFYKQNVLLTLINQTIQRAGKDSKKGCIYR